MWAYLLVSVFGLVLVWCSTAVHAKRLHDIGMSAWWIIAAWGILVLIAYFVSRSAGQLFSLITWMVVGVIPGAQGANRFGPEPTRLAGQKLGQNEARTA
jgi:uncharacterized membrane protein YhaH (DUF805 family)